MIVLGIETSTAVCSVGLFEEGVGGIERSITESHIHSEKLLTLVRDVVEEKQMSLNDIGAVAISLGPGSFTGLRIGLSTAKGLCYALAKPLVTVPTFDAIAEAASTACAEARTIFVLLDAKREELYVGRFNVASVGAVVRDDAVHVLSTTEAATRIPADAPMMIVTDRVEQLSELLGAEKMIVDVHPFCRGSVVAQIGYRKVLSKEFADLASIEPVYLKDFVVRTVAKS
jgi:tRNA threonylcarbamoyladenosine biosynthesis protein TsaB